MLIAKITHIYLYIQQLQELSRDVDNNMNSITCKICTFKNDNKNQDQDNKMLHWELLPRQMDRYSR